MTNPTTYASGSQAATVTTEHFLSSPNVAGTFVLNLDLSVLQAGDAVRIRVYKIIVTGGSTKLVYDETLTYDQATLVPGFVSVPIGNALTDTNSLRFSLTQTLGTSRTFPWSVEQYS